MKKLTVQLEPSAWTMPRFATKFDAEKAHGPRFEAFAGRRPCIRLIATYEPLKAHRAAQSPKLFNAD
ncbi:hypothetical protein [Beijerinckia sp. L45]|uniref:hypothetical protein n=1 Tax=Beijerinckia sp. L45 TaxID=1641855 RepID=UPI00131CC4A9|nr:hypothetical protein [Beijerinckia sp. L45]